MAGVNHAAVSVKQKDETRRGIDGHVQPPGRTYSANKWRRQATRSHWGCPLCSTLWFLAFEGKEVGKPERRRDFSVASSLAFAKRISANENPIIYNCTLNVRDGNVVGVRVHVCFLGMFFSVLSWRAKWNLGWGKERAGSTDKAKHTWTLPDNNMHLAANKGNAK